MSVLLTHLSEVIRSNLAQLLSYRDMGALIDRLEPDYKRLVDEICPAHLSQSGLQAVLKMLLAERASIRNLPQILEAVAEVAPHLRRTEQIVDHVRMRIAPQLCGDLAEGGTLRILRLGNRWDLAFHQALKRDARGEVIDFDVDPRLVEQFGRELNLAIGLANKLTPQIPVFFISMPFMIAGALAVLYSTGGHAVAIFTDGFAQWLRQG
jgi:flagellar biosynthesis protein FlhA